MSNAVAEALRAFLKRSTELWAEDQTSIEILKGVVKELGIERLVQALNERPAVADPVRPVADFAANTELGDVAHGNAPAVIPFAIPIKEPPADILPATEAVSRLMLGRHTAPSAPEPATVDYDSANDRWSKFARIPDEELQVIEQRCRLKMEAVRWQVERARMLESGASKVFQIEPHDRELIDRARQLPECFLWMNSHDLAPLSQVQHFEELAGAFEALAEASGLVHGILPMATDEPDAFAESLCLYAETQSALRTAIRNIEARDDNDQIRAYHWLRRTTHEQKVFIHRHMRSTDPADSANWADRLQRIRELDARLQEGRSRQKNRKKLFANLKYCSQQIQHSQGEDVSHQWDKIGRVLEELLAAGEPASSRTIREYLLPICEQKPDRDWPATVPPVWDEISSFRDRSTETEEPEEPVQQTSELARAAELLEGKSVVLIGGDRRRPQEAALIAALRLKDLHWVAVREHSSVSRFEPYVADSDVVVVLLAIRWSSHSYGEVKEFCDRYGKLLVRLPGGYHPNQVAKQILDQVGDRLAFGM